MKVLVGMLCLALEKLGYEVRIGFSGLDGVALLEGVR
jgi:hypothetical protein